MNEIIKIGFDMVTGIFALIGLVFCIYYIFFRRRLYIKSSACFIVDIDGAGEQLEYYVRRLQSANIKINKIILYSKSGNQEALNICGLLSRDYPNIECCSGVINLEEIV